MLAYLLAPSFQCVNVNGKPLTGGYIQSFLTGTATQAITYSDFSGTQNASQVTLDSMYEPGDYPSKNSRTKEFLLSSVTANSVVGEYNPNATPATKFLQLCQGTTAPTEVSVLVELDLI